MRSTKKLTAVLVLAAATSLTLASCSGGTTGGSGGTDGSNVTITFSWWGDENRAAITNEAIALFEEKNPTIKVTPDYQGFDGYFEKISTRFAGGNPPDVVQLYNEVIQQFADQLADISTLPIDLSAWDEKLTHAASPGETIVALPLALTTQAFAYNNAAFTKYGVELPKEGYTWDDYADTAIELSEASGGAMPGAVDMSGSYQTFEVWAGAEGEVFLDADGPGFSEDTLAEYWEYWKDLRDAGGTTAPGTMADYAGAAEAVTAEAAASSYVFINQYPTFSQEVPGKDVALLRTPTLDGAVGDYLRISQDIAIASKSKHPEAAAKLVDFLLNDPEATAILGTDRGLPPNPNNTQAVTGDLDEQQQQVVDLFEEVRLDGSTPPPPAPAEGADLITLFGSVADQIAFDQLTPAEGAKAYIEQANALVG